MRKTTVQPETLREKRSRAAKEFWTKPENVAARVDALADHVTRIVDNFPPLTEEQRDKLRAAFAPALDRDASGSDPQNRGNGSRKARVVGR